MALDASEIFCRNIEDHKLTEKECQTSCAVAKYVRSVEELKALTNNPHPKVIISASGMATGGRVLHHLKRYAPDAKNTILFAGFQAGGTRGAAMMAGAEQDQDPWGVFSGGCGGSGIWTCSQPTPMQTRS